MVFPEQEFPHTRIPNAYTSTDLLNDLKLSDEKIRSFSADKRTADPSHLQSSGIVLPIFNQFGGHICRRASSCVLDHYEPKITDFQRSI